MFLDDPFMLRALVAGIGIALSIGPLGCFVVWRRMAYFGDALSHASLLGVAIGIVLGIGTTIPILAVGLAISGLLVILTRQRVVATDTLLGIFSHAGLALGLVILSIMASQGYGGNIDLHSFLFGDILAISRTDAFWIWGGAGVVLVTLSRLWQPLLALTVSRDVAQVEGIAVTRTELLFTGLLTLAVAMSITVCGVLLITALLIVPAATARSFSKTPEMMGMLSALFAVLSVIGGLMSAQFWNLPAGPSIVAISVLLCGIIWFILAPLFKR